MIKKSPWVPCQTTCEKREVQGEKKRLFFVNFFFPLLLRGSFSTHLIPVLLTNLYILICQTWRRLLCDWDCLVMTGGSLKAALQRGMMTLE